MKVIACKNWDTGLWDWYCPCCHDSMSGYTGHPLALTCAVAHAELWHR